MSDKAHGHVKAHGPVATWVRAHWHRIKSIATIVFLLAVAVFLGMLVVKVNWTEVFETIRAYDRRTLAVASSLAAASFLVYACFDLLARHYTGHNVPRRTSMLISCVCYIVSMNIGAAVGSAGLRLRLYSRVGLKPVVILRIIAFCVMTNWIGYALLAGVVFASGEIRLPPSWALGSMALQLIGASMVLLWGVYLWFCARSKRRSWSIRGHEFELPSLHIALLQTTLSFVNWALMAGILYVLMPEGVSYFYVLALLLLAAVAGAIIHIPAGVGVLEGIFISILSYTVASYQILASLVVYRAIHYLIPLILAGITYAILETKPALLAGNERVEPDR